jgi:hypothetical protein
MKPILNYFVPFTNGKFVASCLMFSDQVFGVRNNLSKTGNWVNIEYSDIDFWWQDYEHDWFNTTNWRDYLRPQIIENSDKFVFFTCHEDYAVDHVKRLIPESRILTIIPDLTLCRKNYRNKNWVDSEPEFETSRCFKEFQAFNPITSDIVINQTDLFERSSFIKAIEHVRSSLNITLDMQQVLAYHDLYFSHPSNQL